MPTRPALLMLGLLLSACGMTTPTFPDGDLASLTPPETPNWAYACTPGLCRSAPLAAPRFALPPERLFEVARRTVLAQPRTRLVGERVAERRLDVVQLTPLLRFVDSISLEVVPLPDGGSGLIVYSHSNLGRSDLGANRARVEEWLAAISAAAAQG